MTDPMGERLRSLLADRAETAPMPAFSPEDAVARGRTALRRRRALTATAVAVTVVAVTMASAGLVALGRHTTAVPPTAPRATPSDGWHDRELRQLLAGLPAGSPARVDLRVDTHLWTADGRVVDLPTARPVARDGGSVAVVAAQDGWVVVDSTGEPGVVRFVGRTGDSRVLARGHDIGALVSPDGRRAAIHHPQGPDHVVRVVDVHTGATLYRDTLRRQPDGRAFRPEGWAGSSLVLLSFFDDTGGRCPCLSLWDPAKGPWADDGPGVAGRVVGRAEDGTSQVAYGETGATPADECLVVLDPFRRFAVTARYCDLSLDVHTYGLVSPDGRYVTGTDRDGALMVADLRAATQGRTAVTRLRLPAGLLESSGLVWADDRTVLLVPDWTLSPEPRRVDLVRCRVDDGRCERAPVTLAGTSIPVTVDRP
jgi:hypothetical protein